MRFRLFIAAIAAAFIGSAAPASALTFGEDEGLNKLVDVGVVGEKGEALALGYKTTTHNFLLPYSLSDDGYVLLPRSGGDTYYPITPEQISGWQANGLLPKPLPPYTISTLDKVMGHLLWPTLVVIALVYLIPMLRRRKTAPSDPLTGAPPSAP